MTKTSTNYLKNFLKIAPLSHALWRSIEAEAFHQATYNKPILDVGCGWGEFAGVAFGKIEMGIDINEEELKKAQAGKQYKRIELVDARKMKFSSHLFQTVLSVSVLEHIKNNHLAIKEINRVLKPGGLFIFSVPTTSLEKHLLIPKILRLLSQEKLAQTYFKWHSKAFKHVSLKSRNWWRKELEKTGFQIIRETGTISPTVVKLHELFLPFAAPSQIWKLLTGRRLIISVGLRSKILPFYFNRYVYLDKNCDVNMFYIAKKVKDI